MISLVFFCLCNGPARRSNRINFAHISVLSTDCIWLGLGSAVSEAPRELGEVTRGYLGEAAVSTFLRDMIDSSCIRNNSCVEQGLEGWSV